MLINRAARAGRGKGDEERVSDTNGVVHVVFGVSLGLPRLVRAALKTAILRGSKFSVLLSRRHRLRKLALGVTRLAAIIRR